MVNLITTSKEVTKATRQKIMVIQMHKCSNRKRILFLLHWVLHLEVFHAMVYAKVSALSGQR